MKVSLKSILACVILASLPLGAAPRSLKISSPAGESLSFFQSPDGTWIVEQRLRVGLAKRLPLAKLDQARLFEDMRRFVIQYPRPESPHKKCPGQGLSVEIGGFEKATSRELCLSSIRDKAFYGQLRSRLDEALGKEAAGRRLFK